MAIHVNHKYINFGNELVVTIVVLLILAGVTIALVMNNNGVIIKVQEAKNATALSNFKEKLNLANLDAVEEKMIKGSLTINEYFNILKQHGIISDTNIPGSNINEPYINEDGNTVYEVDSDDGFTFDVVVDKNGNITTENIRPSKDAEKPKIRKIEVINKGTNSIEVKVTVAKLESGKLSYYYKKDGEPDSSYKELKTNTRKLYLPTPPDFF